MGLSSASESCACGLMLVPILLHLTGWLPRWLDRLVPDARFGH
jgi:hypothetical protein